MQEERRYFDRTGLKLPLFLSSKKVNTELEAEVRDLGAKGLGIFSKDRLPLEGDVDLKVKVPKKGDFLTLAGNVIWSREYFPEGWRAGIALREQSVNLVAFSVLQDMLNR
ncbi:MAG: PilZ domain-containing protein [Candidatus Omnitrophica bacterium]|nr:PilZ domain-containing protein [Candidatus Omnitrophota bacterium]